MKVIELKSMCWIKLCDIYIYIHIHAQLTYVLARVMIIKNIESWGARVYTEVNFRTIKWKMRTILERIRILRKCRHLPMNFGKLSIINMIAHSQINLKENYNINLRGKVNEGERRVYGDFTFLIFDLDYGHRLR